MARETPIQGRAELGMDPRPGGRWFILKKIRRRATFIAVAALTALAVLMFVAGIPASAVGAFGSPVVVSSLNDSEPGVDVATDGTIYVNAIPGLYVPGPSPSHLWRADG